MIQKPTDGNWFRWVNTNYPFSPKWEYRLLTRTERPFPGTEQQLDDLRGIREREIAASLAQLWFHSTENAMAIFNNVKSDRSQERDKDKRRLIRMATLALEGKLGETKDERDAAASTANIYLSGSPDRCHYWQLSDWEQMHHYARRLTRGETAEKPRLTQDRKQDRERAAQLQDIYGGIDR